MWENDQRNQYYLLDVSLFSLVIHKVERSMTFRQLSSLPVILQTKGTSISYTNEADASRSRKDEERPGMSALIISLSRIRLANSLRRQGSFADPANILVGNKNASETMNAALSSRFFDIEKYLQCFQPACTIQWLKASSAR